MRTTVRRLMLLPVAAAALLLTQALPAQALPAQTSPNFNLRTPYSGGCIRPDYPYGLGSSVHEASCDGNSGHWYVSNSRDNAGKWEYQFAWSLSGGCLIPNHVATGQPLVVTNGTNVCNNEQSYWTQESVGGYTRWVNQANTNLVMDYDSSSANRGLQLWPRWGDVNQEFYTNPA